MSKPLHTATSPRELVQGLFNCQSEVDFVNRKVLIETIGPQLAERFLPALPEVVGVNTTELLMTIKIAKPELIQEATNNPTS